MRCGGGEGESIPNEIEVKLSITSVAAARKKIAKLGAKLVRREVGGKDGRVHELNILFDTPDGGFARHGQLLRVRVESSGDATSKGAKRAVLTYKGPGEPQKEARFKVRDEREVVVADDAAMRGILEALVCVDGSDMKSFEPRLNSREMRSGPLDCKLNWTKRQSGFTWSSKVRRTAIDRAATGIRIFARRIRHQKLSTAARGKLPPQGTCSFAASRRASFREYQT